MKRANSSKTGLFLIEMIFAIAFFMIAAAISLQVFVKANSLSEESSLQAKAAMEAQNIAEIWMQDTNTLTTLQTIYLVDTLDTNTYVIYYNEAWKTCTKNNKVYQANLQVNDETLNISMYKDDVSLFTLPVTRHIPLHSREGR